MFRKIKQSDREVFLEMCREFYASDAVLHNIDESYHISVFNELMRSDNYLVCYIFELDGKIVGYALLNRTFTHEAGGETLWLEDLYIKEDFRDRKLGSGFLRWLTENSTACRLRLETEPDNDRAATLYRRYGFEELPYFQFCRDK